MDGLSRPAASVPFPPELGDMRVASFFGIFFCILCRVICTGEYGINGVCV